MNLSPEDIQRIGELPSAQRNKLPLSPGDDMENSQWRNLVNLRLEVQGNYVFWKTRGGSTLVNSFFGNVLTIYPMESQVDGVITEYLAVHTAAGKVFLWDIDAGTSDEIVATGFSTTQQIQFANIGRFLYMFDYDGGHAEYYDLTDAQSSNFLSYNKAYIHNLNWLAEPLKDGNVWGFEQGEPIIVWPGEVPAAGTEIFNSSTFGAGDAGTLTPRNSKVNSFRYVYEGGKYLKDLEGTEYKETQFLTFPAGSEPFGFTVEGSGADFTIQEYYIPLDEAGDPAFVSYKSKIDKVDGAFITFKDPAGVERTAQIGGVSTGDLADINIVMPFNPDVEEMVGTAASKALSPDGSSVIDNLNYTAPRMYRQYVVYDMLNDGSFTIPGKPLQVEATATRIHNEGGTVLNLSVTAPSDNVEKRFLACTRWQPTADKAFDPVSPEYPNSPLFITGEIDKNRQFIRNKTRDDKLFRGITEMQPMIAGVSDLFDSGSVEPNSVAQFRGSLMMAGYTLNRPVPVPYSDASAATNGNAFANLQSTSQLPNNMALALMFEYSDGRRSSIVETEQFLQEGSVIDESAVQCEQTKGSASHSVTAGVESDGEISITYEGVTVTIPLSVAAHSAPEDVAEAIRQAVEGDANIRLNANVPAGAEIVYTEKRFGEEFNGNVVNAEQAPPFDVSRATYLRTLDINAQSADPDSLSFSPDGTKMYVLSRTGDQVDEYALSTAWDISTATYTDNLDVTAQDTDPDGIFFKPDGTKLWIVGDANNTVFEYDLGTAWDVSTAVYNSNSFSVAAQTTSENSLSFKNDGTVMYLLSQADAEIYVYDLGTAWDVTSAVYNAVSFDLAIVDGSPDSMFFKNDGTKMWVIGDTNDNIYEYELSTAWDVTSATQVRELDVSGQDATPDGMFISPDGLHLYVAGQANDSVYQYDMPAGLGITFDTEDPAISAAAEPEPEPPTGYLVLNYNYVSVGETQEYHVFLDTFDSNTFTIQGGQSRDQIVDTLITILDGSPLTGYSFTKENISFEGELVPTLVIKDTTPGKTHIGAEFGTYPATIDDVNAEFFVGAPGEVFRDQGTGEAGNRPSEPGTVQDVGLLCTQSEASVDVDANNLAAAATEDHTITVDGDATAPITIADTDTLEGIVDKYIAEIQSTPAIDVNWKSEKVDNGDGTWRLLLTFREYGTRGDGRAISVAGNTDVTLTVNSPSTGGSTAQPATGTLTITAGSDGTADIIIGLLFESTIFTDGYYYVEYPITSSQTAEQVAAELGAALQGDSSVTDHYAVSIDGADITFTAVAEDKKYNATITQLDVDSASASASSFVTAGEEAPQTTYSDAVDLGRTPVDLGVPVDLTLIFESPTEGTNKMEIAYEESANGVSEWTEVYSFEHDPSGLWFPEDDLEQVVNGVTISQRYYRVKVTLEASNGYGGGEGTGTIELDQTTGKTDNGVVASTADVAGGSSGLTPSGVTTTISANQLQLHSLNNLISKIYVLGRTTNPVKRFHLIDDFDITDPAAHGRVIELPNTEEELNEIQSEIFTEPPASEIVESVDLSNFAVIGTPFQQFQISTQERIVDQSTILKAMPVDFDSDKSTMRYRVMIFTDRNIQMGYLVDAQAGNQRVFESDFEIVFAGKSASSREGITDLNGNIIWESKDAVYAWAKQGAPSRIFNTRRYSASDGNKLIDVIYSEDYNEAWFIYRNNDIVVFDFDSGSTRRMRYTGVGAVRCGAFFGNKLYIGADTELYETDIAGTLTDGAGGDTVTGFAETLHLGDEQIQQRLLDITIGGQNFSAQVEVDLQPARFEDNATVWSDQFSADKDLGSKTLKMHGESYQIQHMAVMPRIRITLPAVTDGIVSHAILKYVPTENIGKARM